VGFFVAIGLASLVFLALKVANLGGANTGETYRLEAKFDNIGSLKIRAPVKCAGVVVGRVSEIRFDSDNYVALVDMKIDSRYKFPRDTFSSILTSGLLGEQYIGFDVGGDAEVLKNGDVIKKTQSAVVIEKLISEFMFNKAAEAGDKQP
jgi:phospholipid/cholesterol/gamma-HCH transport system substrate-binding protein